MDVQKYINNESVQLRIKSLLEGRAPQFTTSLLSAINSNNTLAQCRPETVLNAALTAASLDLPINSSLGFAYVIPYNNNKKITNADGKTEWVKVYEAQFQIGYKGFIQLAQRSGQYRTINATPIYEGQLRGSDPLRGGFDWDWTVEKKGEPIGYAAYLELINGFQKTLYMTTEEVERHANKYSKSYASDKQYKKTASKWTTDFDLMAQKTVLKLLISKYGPMNSNMQEAVEKDQAIIRDDAIEYVDNEENVGADEQKKKEILELMGDDNDSPSTAGN